MRKNTSMSHYFPVNNDWGVLFPQQIIGGDYSFNGVFIYYDALCKYTPATQPSRWYYYMKRWVFNPFFSHSVKSNHIRSFSGPHTRDTWHLSLFSPNAGKKDQKNAEWGHFSRIVFYQFILIYQWKKKNSKNWPIF